MSIFIAVKLLIEIVQGLNLAGLHIYVSFNLLLTIVDLIPRLFATTEVKELIVVFFVLVLVIADIWLMRVCLKTLWAFL